MLDRKPRATKTRPREANRQTCPYCHGTGVAVPRIDPRALLEALVIHTGPLTFSTRDLVKLAPTNPLLRLVIGNMDARRLGIVCFIGYQPRVLLTAYPSSARAATDAARCGGLGFRRCKCRTVIQPLSKIAKRWMMVSA